MRLSDLKLLTDLAWEGRSGQVDMVVPAGFVTAARRLQREGLIEFVGRERVAMSGKGLAWLDGIIER